MKNIVKRLKQLNQSLPLLIVGILAWGVIVQFSAVWFVDDKIRYSTGTWIGVALAIFMAIHLALVIDAAVTRQSGPRGLKFKSVIRYIVVVVVIFIMVYFNLGNIITAFVAILGLKVSAYAQPFIIKRILKRKDLKEEEVKL